MGTGRAVAQEAVWIFLAPIGVPGAVYILGHLLVLRVNTIVDLSSQQNNYKETLRTENIHVCVYVPM